MHLRARSCSFPFWWRIHYACFKFIWICIFSKDLSCSWLLFPSFIAVEWGVGVCCLKIIIALSDATGMVRGVSWRRFQFVVKVLIAVILTSLCMFILSQYDTAGTCHVVWSSMCLILLSPFHLRPLDWVKAWGHIICVEMSECIFF